MSEVNEERAAENGTPAPLPDGVGLSIEDVRELLFRRHNVAVPADDPTLMQVTSVAFW